MLKKKIAELFEKIKKTKTSTKIMILLPVISMLISTTAPFIPGLLENRIAFDAVSLFALSLIVLFMILLSIKVKKQPWHGILCFFHNMYRCFVLYNIYRVHSTLRLSAVSIRKDINE